VSEIRRALTQYVARTDVALRTADLLPVPKPERVAAERLVGDLARHCGVALSPRDVSAILIAR
jgi:hypothetical protein